MSSDSPIDKAIKASAEGTVDPPKRSSGTEVKRGSELFNQAVYKIEETFDKTLDPYKTKVFEYSSKRADMLVNEYTPLPQDVPSVFKEYSIQSYRVWVDWPEFEDDGFVIDRAERT